jgi:hypothetical protein
VDFVRVQFFKDRKMWSENCVLGTSCRQLVWQLSFVTQILNQLSFLSAQPDGNVDLAIQNSSLRLVLRQSYASILSGLSTPRENGHRYFQIRS